VLLQTQEGAERPGTMVALGAGGPDFRPLNATVLLEATMIDLDAPANSAYFNRVNSSSPRSLVAQYSLSPFGRTIRKIRRKP
jgi:hypothetical protein